MNTRSHTEMEAELLVFLNRKYVQHAGERQRAMGLKYMTAETHDLARELARFIESLSAPKSGRESEGRHSPQGGIARQAPCPDTDGIAERRGDSEERLSPDGIGTPSLDESNQQSGREGLGDPRALHLTKDTARLGYREWDLLRNVLQDSDEFDPQDPEHKALLAKLDWHCADTYRPKPAENE